MKAKLIFDLPEEQTEFKFATQGSDYSETLWRIIKPEFRKL